MPRHNPCLSPVPLLLLFLLSPSSASLCGLKAADGSFWDFAPLRRGAPSPYRVAGAASGVEYLVNLCAPLPAGSASGPCAGPDVSVCRVRDGRPEAALRRGSDEWVLTLHGEPASVAHNGDVCGTGERTSSAVYYVCAENATEPVVTVSEASHGCAVDVRVETALACRRLPAPGCAAEGRGGRVLDFSALAGQVFRGGDSTGNTFAVAPCGTRAVDECRARSKWAWACRTSGPEPALLGQWTALDAGGPALTWSVAGGVAAAASANGDPCGGRKYGASLAFRCQTVGGTGPLEVNGTSADGCEYHFTLPTPLAC